MDWHVKPASKQSMLSERGFNEGDRILCILHTDSTGEMLRTDIFPDEEESFQSEGAVLGRWTRVMKDNVDEEREQQKQALSSGEQLFISLFDEDDDEDGNAVEDEAAIEHKATLKQLLALMLERKRIIRSQGSPQNGVQSYLHSESKRTFEVTLLKLDQERITAVESLVGPLLA